MPEQTLQPDDGAGHSGCLFVHVRSLPAADSEPLLLRPLSERMPLWWLTFRLPPASALTGSGAPAWRCLQPLSSGQQARTPLVARLVGGKNAPLPPTPPPTPTTSTVERVDLRARSLSHRIGKWRIGAWLEELGAFPCLIDFSLLHILKVTLMCSPPPCATQPL